MTLSDKMTDNGESLARPVQGSSYPGSDFRRWLLPACVIESLFDSLKTVSALQPGLDLSSLAGRGQPHHRSSSHAVGQDATVGSTSQLESAQDGDMGQIQCVLQHKPE